MNNKQLFEQTLTTEYKTLYATDPKYSTFTISPEDLAKQMTHTMFRGTGNKEGKGIKRACKTLGINYTYKAIKEFLEK